MFFFTYKTINIINGKCYYGMHCSETLNDAYLGSGTAIKRAIKKYGAEKFSRTILEQFSTKEELIAAEKVMSKAGKGRPKSEETKRKMVEAAKLRWALKRAENGN